MNKLQRIEEMEKQLAALRAEVEQEAKPNRWEPKGGDFIFYSAGVTPCRASAHLKTESSDFGIMRQTKEQAEADYKLARAYNRLLAYKAEFDADFVPDFNDQRQKKSYVYFDHDSQIFDYSANIDHQALTAVYFSEQAARDLCDKLNFGEVVL